MNCERLYWYWLATCGVSYLHAQVFLRDAGSFAALFDSPSQSGLSRRTPSRMVEKLVQRADLDLLAREILQLEQKGIAVVTFADPTYPPLLAHIASPPLVLYVRGDLSRLSEKLIAMVGTRHASREGLHNTRKVARELSEYGVSIVSGLARGIDTAANAGALEGNTPCAAVLGCGIDQVYPAENKSLFRAIIERGALISEYPPGVPPLARNFPTRNRIISGMCVGVAIIEGLLKSGAAITMRHAVAENRDVFALPGNISNPNATLPNKLLSEGAIPLLGASTILDYYGWNANIQTNFTEILQPELDFLEQELYTLLKQGDLSIDQLISISHAEPSQVNLALVQLELKGYIERLPGNLYGISLQ